MSSSKTTPSYKASPAGDLRSTPQRGLALRASEAVGESEQAASRILIGWSGDALRGFWVDLPKTIVSLAVADIFPIPPLIRRVLGSSPLWGVGRLPRGLLLLVDLAAHLDGEE